MSRPILDGTYQFRDHRNRVRHNINRHTCDMHEMSFIFFFCFFSIRFGSSSSFFIRFCPARITATFSLSLGKLSLCRPQIFSTALTTAAESVFGLLMRDLHTSTAFLTRAGTLLLSSGYPLLFKKYVRKFSSTKQAQSAAGGRYLHNHN